MNATRIGAYTVEMNNDLETVDISGFGEMLHLQHAEALKLLAWLHTHKTVLQEQANSSYDCKECGGRHVVGLTCPTLARE